MSSKFWLKDNTVWPFYFFKDSLEVFINRSFSAWIIFDKFQSETTQVDIYCPVDFVQLGKLYQFLSKVQMVHIILYFSTCLEHSDQGTIWLDPIVLTKMIYKFPSVASNTFAKDLSGQYGLTHDVL